MEKINAAELVKRVINHPQGSIERLIALSKNDESEWLEFKAALLPKDNIGKDKENEIDYIWHVTKAIIALANTHGGAVILGIDDSKRPVPLSASDKNDKLRNGEDCFARDVLDVAFKPESKNWKCFKETYSLDNKVFYNLLEYKFMDYQSNRVVLIIVNPVQKNDDLILVEEIHKGREILLTRALGEIGKVNEEFKSIVISNYKMSRKPEQEKYEQLYQQFLHNLSHNDTNDIKMVENDIDDYLSRIKNSKEYKYLDNLYTPLEAEENFFITSETDLFDPQVIENFLDDDISVFNEEEWEEHLNDNQDENDDECSYDHMQDNYQSEIIPRSGNVFELMKQVKSIFLIGEPGGGKSTTLLRRCHQLIKEYHTDQILPVFVPLSKYANGDSLYNLISKSSLLKRDTLEFKINKNELVLLLDALNECNDNSQPSLIKEINSLITLYPDLQLVISTRTINFKNQIKLPVFKVQELNRKQQEQFLTNYLKDEIKAELILEQLYQQPGGEIIANNPWMLRMIALISNTQKELPKGRVALYKKFIDEWIAREIIKLRKANKEVPWCKEDAFDKLVKIAGIMRINGYNKQAYKQFHYNCKATYNESALERAQAVWVLHFIFYLYKQKYMPKY